jgi:peptide/nickel transport system permease protein
MAVIIVIVLCAILAPEIVQLVGARPPDQESTAYMNQYGAMTGPSGHNLFGVDPLGRDIFSRVLYGARTSLIIAFAATAIGVCFGTLFGMLAGYYPRADMAVSRVLDLALAFPLLLLAFGLASACGTGSGCVGGAVRPGVPLVIGLLALASFPYVARLVRGQVLSIRRQEFIESARAIGTSNRRIMYSEILPNLLGPLLVYSTLMIPTNILLEAALSYLGVGVQPPTPSWGSMIADASNTFTVAWWYLVFPGVALLITVLAFNLVGDALRDALLPRRSGRSSR